jgi:hypothetical protein
LVIKEPAQPQGGNLEGCRSAHDLSAINSSKNDACFLGQEGHPAWAIELLFAPRASGASTFAANVRVDAEVAGDVCRATGSTKTRHSSVGLIAPSGLAPRSAR